MAEPALVAARALGFRYGGDVVLEGIDLAIAPGDRLAILGPNGGGKSTLVRLLLGLLRPASGSVTWSRPARGRRLGYVPQVPAFDRGFPLKVEEMVLQGRLRDRGPLRRFRAEDHAAVEAMLEQLDLEPLRGAYLTELSGGQLKRALIARALVGEPELLVLDEAAASLDEASRRRLWERVAALPPACAVLLVTHDLGPGTFVPGRAVLVDRTLETLSLPDLHQHPLLCGHGHG